MKSLSHFENFARPAALRRFVSYPRTNRSFTTHQSLRNRPNVDNSLATHTCSPLPRQPRPSSAHIQFP
jgi:hypothetical protein